MGRITFETNLVDIGFIEPNSLNNVIDFNYAGNSKDITAIRPLCGCTGQGVIFNDRLQFLFNEEATRNLSKEDIKNNYPSNIYDFHKSIEVYFNDDKDLFITNPNGIRVYNPEKDMTTISFTGKVDLLKI